VEALDRSSGCDETHHAVSSLAILFRLPPVIDSAAAAAASLFPG
jgi:hypothetical protein